ncbi:hypothetical protein BpHYR1_021165 [Brachionus plicatilis]|uniref:Uncharacterized protein n=1 Tax=Brachionus plicatilis TaxID=10195 RepID=A0A3M7PLV8_BRAPC|nr:hypothetical protein BpHYR1_021165 [Brachionus plicatilis]
MNASIIPIDPSPRFLGHILDPKLSFNNHFESISARIIGKTNLIRKIRIRFQSSYPQSNPGRYTLDDALKLRFSELIFEY